MNLDYLRGLLEAARHVLWEAEIKCEPELRNAILDICVDLGKLIDTLEKEEENEN